MNRNCDIGNPKSEKAMTNATARADPRIVEVATAMAKENYAALGSLHSLVISEQRDETMAKEFSAEMPKSGVRRSLSLSLDLCLRLANKTFLCISIPRINTTCLSSSSKHRHHHHHNYDETPCFDCKGPFPLPGITGPHFCSTVVGHTLFVTGGDPGDIQGFDDIRTERLSYPYARPSPPKRNYSSPPPRNRIIDQLHNLTNEYLCPFGKSETLTSCSSDNNTIFPPSQWGDEFDFETIATPLTFSVDDPTYADTSTTVTGHVDTALTTLWEDPTQIPTRTTGFFSWFAPPPVTTALASTSSTETVPATPTTTPEPPNEPIKGLCHKIWSFDLSNPDLGWSQGNSLISPRIYPILVPYLGKLYAFSGNHPSLTFAEVYDPLSATWSELPPPPFRRLPDTQMYVVPLKGWDKLWVFGVHRAVDYTFDVVTRKWQKLSVARHILPYFTDRYQLVSALTPKEKHMVVYWINEQKVVYAYNLSTTQIFKGDISDTDFQVGSLGILSGLHHLRRDLFGLIGRTYLQDPLRTIVHVIVLQISLPKSPVKAGSKIIARSKICEAPTAPLTTSVVASFTYPLMGQIPICDSYLMSKNVQINEIN